LTRSPLTAESAMPLTIRRATSKDAAGFARMMGDPAIYPGLMQMPFTSEELWEPRLAAPAVAAKPDLQLVAEREGDEGLEMVGSAGLHAAGVSPRRRHVMYLGISVMPAAQNQGVGSALMQALCDYADRWAQVLRLEQKHTLIVTPSYLSYVRVRNELMHQQVNSSVVVVLLLLLQP